MAKSGSLLFPIEENFENGSMKRATSVEQVIASAVKLFLLTDPGSRVGNPIGSFLPSLKQKTLPKNTLPQISDELKKELSKQFSGVTFIKTDVSQDFEDGAINLKVEITFSTPVSDLTELSVTL